MTDVAPPERLLAGSGTGVAALADFEEHLAATHARCAIGRTRPRGEPFRSSITRAEFGELALVDAAVGPLRARRGRRELAGGDGGVVGVQLVVAGRERVGGAELLEPGGMLVWDAARAIDIEVLEPLVKRTLVIPRERARAICPALDRVVGRPLSARSPSVRLFTTYVETLAAELPHLDAAGREAASRAALELLRGVLAGERGTPAGGGRDVVRDVLRDQIVAHVEGRLGDPALCPQSIADAHAISLRTLYALFEPEGESIGARIRRRRLERCHDELLHAGTGSVTEVAYRWGFRDTAHFSRAFRRHFGTTPSAVRRAAAAP